MAKENITRAEEKREITLAGWLNGAKRSSSNEKTIFVNVNAPTYEFGEKHDHVVTLMIHETEDNKAVIEKILAKEQKFIAVDAFLSKDGFIVPLKNENGLSIVLSDKQPENMYKQAGNMLTASGFVANVEKLENGSYRINVAKHYGKEETNFDVFFVNAHKKEAYAALENGTIQKGSFVELQSSIENYVVGEGENKEFKGHTCSVYNIKAVELKKAEEVKEEAAPAQEAAPAEKPAKKATSKKAQAAAPATTEEPKKKVSRKKMGM